MVNSGKVLPNDGGVLFSPDMGKLGRFDGKDNFGAGKVLLLQKDFGTFGVGSCGMASRPHITPNSPFFSKRTSIWIFQSS
jgi:hypothetical protein